VSKHRAGQGPAPTVDHLVAAAAPGRTAGGPPEPAVGGGGPRPATAHLGTGGRHRAGRRPDAAAPDVVPPPPLFVEVAGEDLVMDPPGGVTAAESAELGKQVRHGLKWSVVNNAVARIGQVVVGIVLARLLTPYDYGVFATALVAYAVLISCSELGVTIALVSRRGDSRQIGPTVTTLSWASGTVLTLAIWFGAPSITAHLKTADATNVLRVLGLAIFVAGLSAVPSAIVQRDFQQRSRFVADTANFVVSTVVAIAGVLLGGGALALAWSRVAGNAVSGVILAIASRERFRPGFDPPVARDLLRFGLPLAGASALAFAVLNVDYVVVARVLGPVMLGYYLVAFNLSGFPVSTFSAVVRSVSLPGFGRLRESPAKAGEAFVFGTRLLVTVSLLASVMLAVLARPLIEVVYGPKWTNAAVPLVFLSGLGLVRVFHELAYDYLSAWGVTRVLFVVQAVWLGALVVVLPIGAHYGGLRGVGLGHLAVAFGLVVPMYVVVLGRHAVPLRPLALVLVRPAVATAGAAAGALVGMHAVSGALAQVLLGGTLGTAVYLAVVGPSLPDRWQLLSPWRWVRFARRDRAARATT
jgi:PST family polysaccharide transporter